MVITIIITTIITTTIIIIIIIIIISPRPGNTRLMSSGGQSHLMRKGILISLGWQSFQRLCLDKNTGVEAPQTQPSVIMSELCLEMRQKLTTYMGPDSQSKDPRSAGVLNKGTLVVVLRILSLVIEESGLAKRIRSLWSAIY